MMRILHDWDQLLSLLAANRKEGNRLKCSEMFSTCHVAVVNAIDVGIVSLNVFGNVPSSPKKKLKYMSRLEINCFEFDSVTEIFITET